MSLRKIMSFADVRHFKPQTLQNLQHIQLSSKLQHFKRLPKKLHLQYPFSTEQYDSVVQKMNVIGSIADKMDHHPDWTLSCNRLSIYLNTHDIKDISEKDYLLAFIAEQVLFTDPEKELLEKWLK